MNGLTEFYDELSNNYDKQRSNSYFKLIEDIEYSTLKGEIDPNSISSVLEVGCGTGIFLDRIQSEDYKLFGIDPSKEMLKVAYDKLIHRDTTLINADAQNIPFEDSFFDLVYSFKVLAHILDLDLALNEVNRVLRTDGIVILEFYNRHSLRKLFTQGGYYHKWHSDREIRKIVSDAGFKIYDVIGARILIPFAFLMEVPIVRRILRKLEFLFSKTYFKRFAGYYIVICRKDI